MNATLATIAPDTYDRRRYIGGSTIAGILGLQPPNWRTAVQIWERMTSEDVDAPEPPREQRRVLARGQIVEPLVARMLEVLHGITGATRGNRYVDPDVPYFAAEIDLELPLGAVSHLFPELLPDAQDTELVNVEIKTVHPFAAHEWGEEGTEDVPIHYAAQVQWGMGVTRRRFALCAALFGADDLVLYPMVRDVDTIAGMRERADVFWNDHVLLRMPPPAQTIADTLRLWPKDDGSELKVSADDPIVAHLRTLDAMKGARLTYEKGEEGVKLLVTETMKRASRIMFGDVELATWNTHATSSIDADALKANFPDAYKACRRQGTTRVLRIKEKNLP